MTLEKWHFRVTDDDRVNRPLLDQDLASTFKIVKNSQSLIDFPYFFSLPASFRHGKLVIHADVIMAGKRLSVSREADFTREDPARLHPPVAGLWKYSNGPGEMAFHPHYHDPLQRYAYDLTMQKPVGGGRRTFEGDPDTNESYFAWNQPIRAVADGIVIEVADDMPDNLGRKGNPANKSKQNGRVVVEHLDPSSPSIRHRSKFSSYVHVRQGSAMVEVGQKVKAGELLARVGNAGMSTEPHLHFQYTEIDRTGRHRAVPVQFSGLKSPEGRVLTGVPKGAAEYRTDRAAPRVRFPV